MATNTPDPWTRYQTATEEIERLRARVTELGEERARALTQIREEQGVGLRKLAEMTGLSMGRVQELTRGADTTRSSKNVGRPRKKPADG